MRSLAERLRAFEQQKARLADAEAKLKLAEKKAHYRRLAEAGGLVAKVGLDKLSSEALFGALLSLHDKAEDSKTVEQWTMVGTRALAGEANEGIKGTEPIILTLPGKASKASEIALREAGFRFNRILCHWEGLADLDGANKLAAAHGGEAHKALITASAPSPIKSSGKS